MIPAVRTRAAACYAIAAGSALLYVVLGLAVSRRPPTGVDRAAAALVGQATPLAAFLTKLGRFEIYVPVCACVLIAGLARRAWLGRAVSSIAFLIAAQSVSDALKAAFARPRPAHWLVTRETSYSYASGHATLSLTFYGFWAYVAVRSGLPRPARLALALGCLLLSGAIGWSRLALGAHFPSDVAGGYLLGVAFLALEIATVPERVLRFPARKAARPRTMEVGGDGNPGALV